MVPINSSGSILEVAIQALEAKAIPSNDESIQTLGFRAWITNEPSVIELLNHRLRALLDQNFEFSTYAEVAALGYRLATPNHDELNIVDVFSDGLKWMQGRKFFLPGRPFGFEIDGLANLGIALGIRSLASSRVVASESEWLSELIQQSNKQASPESWTLSLQFISSALLQDPNSREVLITHECHPVLMSVFASKGLVNASSVNEEAARIQVLDPAEIRDLGVEQALAYLSALGWLFARGASITVARPGWTDVATLLKRVPHALKRWPWEDKPRTSRDTVTAQKWDIQHEYHVQSLIWTILAPVFEDLQDEEYLKSLGHLHPRADLAIPSIQLIVEIKFARDGTQSEWAKLIGEVSADAGLYLADGSGFIQLVPFVWDHSRSTDQHQELINGLCQLPGVPAAIVVPRPGRWK